MSFSTPARVKLPKDAVHEWEECSPRAHQTSLPFAAQATRLRRFDDLAKVPGAKTPGLKHYKQLMRAVAL